MKQKVLERARDYAVAEPSFTAAFMAWEMGISRDAATKATNRLLALGIIEQVEARSGPYAAVYAYKPIRSNGHRPRRLFAELDESRIVADLAPKRGEAVPHVTVRGRSGKPGENKRRQARGVKIKPDRGNT